MIIFYIRMLYGNYFPHLESPRERLPARFAGTFVLLQAGLIAAYRPFFVVLTRCVHACLQV